jgi:endoglucanase
MHETWLMEVTSLPTAAGREERVLAWLDAWIRPRRARVTLTRDDAGNVLILRKDMRRSDRPLLATAHLDHPAFVVTGSGTKQPSRSRNARAIRPIRELTLEFRGGVHDPYFAGARIEVIDMLGARHGARIRSLDAKATPFKRVTATLDAPARAGSIREGDIARWELSSPRIVRREMPASVPGGRARTVRVIETHACDDLAAVAAACAAFDSLLAAKAARNFGLLFTTAEEVGFIGAIHAARGGFVPRGARLVCLENSRSFPHDSPIGAGAILRVGDRLSVFSPHLTNALSELFAAHAKVTPGWMWQRKLMPGGACEATAFASYGIESTCLCLPLGNYHNMTDIDGVLAGKRPARVGPEFVSVDDFHGLVDMLRVAATGLDRGRRSDAPAHRPLMEKLYRERQGVLAG